MIVPVIHCLNYKQIKHNLEICQRNGIKMVFLINHAYGQSAIDDLTDWFQFAKSDFPDIKIGLNFLQLETVDSINLCDLIGADAIWSDYQGTTSRKAKFFGPVAFKYQKHVPNDETDGMTTDEAYYIYSGEYRWCKINYDLDTEVDMKFIPTHWIYEEDYRI